MAHAYGQGVDLSGIIFAVLALAWAVYLIPKVLKHHDEIARTRSIERFSTAMRVLARREPVNRRDARLVVTPARPASSTRVQVPSAPAAAVAAVTASVEAPARVRRPAARGAANAAARRRRHILGFLVLSALVTTGVAAFGYLPWWSVSIPAALAVLYVVLCRTQVRRENAASWITETSPAVSEDIAPRRAIRVDAPYGTPRAPREFEEFLPDEDTVALSSAALSAAVAASSAHEADAAAARVVEVDTVAVAVPTTDGGSLWDPLPVTLPTYVSKPRAARTVRTIDLSEPGTWTSGHTAADSRLVEEAAAAVEEATSFGQDGQRAVGS